MNHTTDMNDDYIAKKVAARMSRRRFIEAMTSRTTDTHADSEGIPLVVRLYAPWSDAEYEDDEYWRVIISSLPDKTPRIDVRKEFTTHSAAIDFIKKWFAQRGADWEPVMRDILEKFNQEVPDAVYSSYVSI